VLLHRWEAACTCRYAAHEGRRRDDTRRIGLAASLGRSGFLSATGRALAHCPRKISRSPSWPTQCGSPGEHAPRSNENLHCGYWRIPGIPVGGALPVSRTRRFRLVSSIIGAHVRRLRIAAHVGRANSSRGAHQP
jgi:hypothetical protein